VPVNRRDFLLGGGVLGALAASGVVVPMAFVLTDEDDAPIGATGAQFASFPRTRVGSLAAVDGGAQFFEYPLEGQSNIMVKLSKPSSTGVGPNRTIVAYSNLCTHMGCLVTAHDAERDVLGPCPCHFSTFDLARDGQVALGQATQNLPQVHLDIVGDDVFANGVFRLVYGHTNTLGGASVSIAGAQ
jgi:arsenite oxidase small subunit